MGVSVLITWETPTVNSCSSEDDKAMGVHPHRPLRPKPKDDPWASPLPRFVFLKGVLLALQSQGRKQVQKGTIIFIANKISQPRRNPSLMDALPPWLMPWCPPCRHLGSHQGVNQGCSGQSLPSLPSPQSPSQPAVDIPPWVASWDCGVNEAHPAQI